MSAKYFWVLLGIFGATSAWAEDFACRDNTGCTSTVQALVQKRLQEHFRIPPQLTALQIGASLIDGAPRPREECSVFAHWSYNGTEPGLGDFSGDEVGVWVFNNQCEVLSERVQVVLPFMPESE